ncbi:6-phosphogluconate dehydrogenase [Marinigracilibium pacificum]|uniref:6-phosphogluconate dehydrogenase n=1 Tax=Marinigracilibium pacificum TaxID=2729599 RepID=A0A848J7F1_9BACT|nr:6-phosphogluconate dehydrogenase [Marinigracilibium pacificum]NMM49032.1 6-phosphogluconate dehydrogenase [Marinigracilibium pacificum]
MDKIKKIFRWTIGIIIVAAIGVFLFLNYASYSSGYRVGTPIKLSKKGMVIKTWEGEMNIGGLTSSDEGVIPTSWQFSIHGSDKDVIENLNAAIENGNRVKLFYKEKYVRFFWQGDTKYFVYEVESVGNK